MHDLVTAERIEYLLLLTAAGEARTYKIGKQEEATTMHPGVVNESPAAGGGDVACWWCCCGGCWKVGGGAGRA